MKKKLAAILSGARYSCTGVLGGGGGVALVRDSGSSHASSFQTANATFECLKVDVYPSCPGRAAQQAQLQKELYVWIPETWMNESLHTHEAAETLLHSFQQKIVVSVAFIVFFPSSDDLLMGFKLQISVR